MDTKGRAIIRPHAHPHQHLRLNDELVTHQHEHGGHGKDGSDFNPRHHHSPKEHERLDRLGQHGYGVG